MKNLTGKVKGVSGAFLTWLKWFLFVSCPFILLLGWAWNAISGMSYLHSVLMVIGCMFFWDMMHFIATRNKK